jgi:hypothetical protein
MEQVLGTKKDARGAGQTQCAQPALRQPCCASHHCPCRIKILRRRNFATARGQKLPVCGVPSSRTWLPQTAPAIMNGLEKYRFACRVPYSTADFSVTAMVVFRNSRIIKVEMKAGAGTMKLEKYLFRKMNQWKVVSSEHGFFAGIQYPEPLMEVILAKLDGLLP